MPISTSPHPLSRERPGLGTLAVVALIVSGCSVNAKTYDPRAPDSPLHLVRAIELPNVKGRIDHMAVDEEGKHLFVAEYGNGSVDDVDLASGKIAVRITGLHEPQGVAWLAAHHEIAVASGDGLLTFYGGDDRHMVAQIRLGDDADDVRVDDRNGNLVVGYGSGALAVIDPASHRVVRQLNLPAHPEGFALLGARVVVNVPDAAKVITADLDQARLTGTLSTGPHFRNYAMAADTSGRRIAVSFRVPSTLIVMDAGSGTSLFTAETCGDVDDVYFRAPHIVAICGAGGIEMIDDSSGQNTKIVSTRQGARTGLIAPRQDKLFVALPSRDGSAAIWELSFQ